tara:strand:- start:292 stop:1680 length:1389 start_codon:yes stop_codon:yes gene_type:complete
MSVYLRYEDGIDYPIAFDECTHTPDRLILRYAICKHRYPQQVDTKLRKKCGMKSVIDAVQRVAYLINQLAKQVQTDGSIGVHYLTATYVGNMEPLINSMYYEGGWLGDSIEQYVKAWRQFYRFLTLQGVEHEMMMPQTNEVVIDQSQDDNILSHTDHRNEQVGETETAIDQNWKERHDDYKDSILSMEQFWLLYAELHKVDSVYAVMAYTELVTCLRISALINCFPLGSNKLNPKWSSYLEMKRDNLTSQRLRYIAKGGKTKSLLAPVNMMEVFHHVYEKPESGLTYNQRLKKYRDRYCKTKYALNTRRTAKESPTWLKRNGTPVSVRDYQNKIQECAKRINIEAHSHILRHTGVTQMLYRYLKNNGLLASLSYMNQLIVNDAHTILKQHLGHVRVATTKRYIRTIERIIQESQLDMLLNTALSTSRKHQKMLDDNPILAKGVKMLEKAIEGADKQLDYNTA